MDHLAHINGFNIITHNPNRNISNKIKEILDEKNKGNNKNIQGYLCPGGRLLDESKFKEVCADNFKRYFETAAHEGPLRIPWKKPKKTEKIIKNITDVMYKWCQYTNEDNSTKGLVLHSFSIWRHAVQLGFPEEMLKGYIEVRKYSEVPIIVVYNPQEKAVLLVRKAKTEMLTVDLEHAVKDLKLFILLFHDVLANSGMKVVPLVVTDEKVNPDDIDCSQCKNHVLSEKQFADIDTFNGWWVAREKYFDTKYKGNIDEASSKIFLEKLTGVLAAAQLYPNYIPKFTDKEKSYEHMEHLKVLLTPEQLDVYYSQEKHMVIKGGFGCGKSIIANVMLEKISKSLKDDEKLYYVCFDPRSELLHQIVKGDQEKVILIENKKKMKLSEIIDDLTKEKKREHINIIVDEYDGEYLDKSEARKINRYIKKSFREAFFVLIAQPIEKVRMIKKSRQYKNKFKILKNKNTMATYHLHWNMRNSIEIHELIEATKKVLSGVTTFFVPEDSRKEGIGGNSFTNEFASAQEVKSAHGLKTEGKRELKGQSSEKSPNFHMELDEAQAFIGSPQVNNTGGNGIVSSFSHAVVTKTGHKINTVKPVLFELADMEEFKKDLSLIVIFKKILKVYNKHVVLHFNTQPNAIPSALRFAVNHYSKMPKKIITEYQEFQKSKESILVCSYPKFRGLEHPIITILIDRDIYYQQHYLIEMIARCTSEHYVVVLQNSEALRKVTDEWKDNNLVDHCKINITDKSSQRKDVNLDCDFYPKVISAEYKSKYYKKLEKAFKLYTSMNETIAANTEIMAKDVIDSITR